MASHPASKLPRQFWKLDKLGSSKPLVVRFDGNAAAEGLHILAQADRVNLHVAQTMEEAAQQAARLAANGKEVR